MNLKSVLCAVALFTASGVAQAFPDYTWYPKEGETLTSTQELAMINLTFKDAKKVEISTTSVPYFENEEGDEIEVEIRDFSSLQAGVVGFACDDSEIKINGAWTLTVPAGTFVVDGEESPKITASWQLNDPLLNIGEYPQIELVSLDPAAGSKLPEWGGENFTRLNIKTSDDAAVNYIEWKLYDITDGKEEWLRQGNDNRYDYNRYHHHDDIWVDGLYIALGSPTKLVLGHTYRLDLRFYGIGYDDATNQNPSPDQLNASEELVTSVTYEGLTPPQEYAEATYVSVTPDPSEYEIVDPEFAHFTIEYSAPAKPVEFSYAVGMGAGNAAAGEWAPFEGMEVDKDGLATKWTFTFYESVVADNTGTLLTNVVSKDADGLYVKGNAGYDFDDIYYSIEWVCNCGAPALISVSPEAGAEVESLSSITVSNDKDGRTYVMNLSYQSSEKVRIVTRDGAEVRILDEPTCSVDLMQATWTFEPITEEGSYILMIPNQYFFLGEEFEGSISNAASFEYYVTGNSTPSDVTYDIVPAEITPADGATVESIKTVTFAFNDFTFVPMNGSAPKIQLYAKEGPGANLLEEIDPLEMEADDYWNPTAYTLNFEEITAEGEYMVVIPQGVFCNEAYDLSEGASGRANAEIVINYTIGSVAPGEVVYDFIPVSITPENYTKVEEIATVTLTFGEVLFPMQTIDGFSYTFVPAELYKLTGNDEELLQSVDPIDNPASDWFSPTIYDFNFEPVTENGQYKVAVKEGTFGDDPFLGSNGTEGRTNPAIDLYYAIGEEVGVEAIVGEAAIINVYDVNGVQILKNANVEAAKELRSGLYIINGKKVMIRR